MVLVNEMKIVLLLLALVLSPRIAWSEVDPRIRGCEEPRVSQFPELGEVRVEVVTVGEPHLSPFRLSVQARCVVNGPGVTGDGFTEWHDIISPQSLPEEAIICGCRRYWEDQAERRVVLRYSVSGFRKKEKKCDTHRREIFDLAEFCARTAKTQIPPAPGLPRAPAPGR